MMRGVASGPMTATFVLAFAQGAATSIETANVLVDGFGVIAMVAMAPVLSLMILGTVFKFRKTVYHEEAEDVVEVETGKYIPETLHHCLMITVECGFGDLVVEVARESGARGATIYHRRGYFEDHHMQIPLVNLEVAEEQEMVYLITPTEISEEVATALVNHERLETEANISLYITHITANITDFES